VVEADADHERRLAQRHELTREDLERVRIVPGIGEAGDADALATDGRHEVTKIGGGGGDRQGRRHQERQQHYFLTKIALGTMQCTPLRMSTTWLTRQSPTIDVSA